MKNLFPFYIIIILELCCQCNSVDNSVTTTNTGNFAVVAPDLYNKKIAEGYEYREDWTSTPMLITEHLFDPEYNIEEKQHYAYDETENNDGSLTVTIIQEALKNDLIYGEKIILLFSYQEDVWVIKNIKKAYKCRKGKEHDEYWKEACK